MPHKFKHFKTAQEALAYVMPELLSTLQDDLERMENDEREFYTNADRTTMKRRIADLEAIAGDVTLRDPRLAAPLKLSDLQRAVLKLYADGEYASLADAATVGDLEAGLEGDTLALFLVREAHDASNATEYLDMLDRAVDQITDVMTKPGSLAKGA